MRNAVSLWSRLREGSFLVLLTSSVIHLRKCLLYLSGISRCSYQRVFHISSDILGIGKASVFHLDFSFMWTNLHILVTIAICAGATARGAGQGHGLQSPILWHSNSSSVPPTMQPGASYPSLDFLKCAMGIKHLPQSVNWRVKWDNTYTLRRETEDSEMVAMKYALLCVHPVWCPDRKETQTHSHPTSKLRLRKVRTQSDQEQESPSLLTKKPRVSATTPQLPWWV